MKSQRGFISSLLLALITVLIIGGGAYVYVQRNQTNQQAVVSPTTQATSTTQTSDWKTYTNTKYGLSFEYPPSWFIRESLDNNIVAFAKSELAQNDVNGFKKIFLTLYISDLILGKEGSGFKATAQDYFSAYYGGTLSSASSRWLIVDKKPVFYQYGVGTNSHILVEDYSYLLFTDDKILIFKVTPGVLLNSITGPWQPTTYEQSDDNLIKQLIGTLSFSDKSVQFVNAGGEISTGMSLKMYTDTRYGFSFQYPSDWQVVTLGSESAAKPESGNKYLYINIKTVSDTQTLQQYLDSQNLPTSKFGPPLYIDWSKSLTIDGFSALQRGETSTSAGFSIWSTYFKKDGIIFDLSISGRDRNYTQEDVAGYNQILSTLKFNP